MAKGRNVPPKIVEKGRKKVVQMKRKHKADPVASVSGKKVKLEVSNGMRAKAPKKEPMTTKKNNKKSSPPVNIPSVYEIDPSVPKPTDLDLVTDIEDKCGSTERAMKIFEKIIWPAKSEEFFRDYWEQKELLVLRRNPTTFTRLISIDGIDQMLKQNIIEFTKDIDIAVYENGKRSTLNPEGRALPATVWEFFNEGGSVRLLNPGQYFPQIYKLCAILQELFCCRVGANVYLTPADSQGFAPHFDDIEAFVLQVSGKKRWRLYAPLSEAEQLPRESSQDFNEKEIGQPILDVILEPGDMLYFPRGVIHQALCADDAYSLHVTLSCYQKNTWGDLLKRVMEDAIDKAMNESLQLRRGIPIDLLQNLGFANSNAKKREEYMNEIQNLMPIITGFVNRTAIDQSVDHFALEYQHSALPPPLSRFENERSAYGATFKINKGRDVLHGAQLTDASKIRLLKANILRLVQVEKTFYVYYHTENTTVFHEKDLTFLEANPEDAERIKHLIENYPEYVAINTLPTDPDAESKYPESDEEDDDGRSFHKNLDFAQYMFDKGLLMVKAKMEVSEETDE